MHYGADEQRPFSFISDLCKTGLLSYHHPTFSSFSTRLWRICLAFGGVSATSSSSSRTLRASSLFVNARSLACLSVMAALETPSPSAAAGKLSRTSPSRRDSSAAEPLGMKRSTSEKMVAQSCASCAAPKAVNDWRVRMLDHNKSWSLPSASRQTRRKEAADRALLKNSIFLLRTLNGSSSSGVIERAEESSFIIQLARSTVLCRGRAYLELHFRQLWSTERYECRDAALWNETRPKR